MKKVLLTCIASVAIAIASFGQAPQGFKYQAVVRDAGNLILNNQAVGMQLMIQQGSIGGTAVYTETFATTTNAYGLINLEIGTGTTSDDFTTIDWANGPYFMETAVDATGGTSYVVMGTSQLMSVPFALYAKTAENTINDAVDDADNDPTNEIETWGTLSGIPAGFSDNVDNVDDADSDPTNEIETWVTLTGIPADFSDDVDDVDDADADPTNELQAVSFSNDTLYLSNGGSVYLGGYAASIDGDWTVDGSGNMINANSGTVSTSVDANVNSVTVGRGSGNSLYNATLGSEALLANIGGTFVTAIGYQALYSNTLGYWNTAVGASALYTNTSGYTNTAIGMRSLYYNTTGYRNTANGYRALMFNDDGFGNTAIGYQTLRSNLEGDQNTAAGYRTLYSNTTGYSNVAVGVEALYSNTTISNLVAIGDSALYNNGTGATGPFEAHFNTALGSKALFSNTTGYGNTANGTDALYNNTSGAGNTANGVDVLNANTTGDFNTASGVGALNVNTFGSFNTANGFEALVANTEGNFNTATGHQALYDNTTGSFRSGFGLSANSTGSAYDNSTGVGFNADCNASDQVRIGNSSVTSIGGYANWTNLSDARFKENIEENVKGLEFIEKLRPVTYHMSVHKVEQFFENNYGQEEKGDWPTKYDKEQIRHTGFIAQEVEQAAKEIGYDFSGVDAPKNDKDFYGLRYAAFVVPLVKAVQELNEELETKSDEISILKKENELMRAGLEQIEQQQAVIEIQQNEIHYLKEANASSNESIKEIKAHLNLQTKK